MRKTSRTAAIVSFSFASICVTGCSSSARLGPQTAALSGSQVSPGVEQVGEQFVFEDVAKAIEALKAAMAKQDQQELVKLFGPNVESYLSTGDKSLDGQNVAKFSKALSERAEVLPLTLPGQSPQAVAVIVGNAGWPFPIPLVSNDNGWRFDAVVGREELRSRVIGKNELRAIATCQEYVLAQYEFASLAQGSSEPTFAKQLASSPGKHDGLYWHGEPKSPFGPMVAKASTEPSIAGSGPKPFNGYLFKVLTGQGPMARGGALNYLKNGKMSGGFALLAYPADWSKSGIMSFVVGPDGVVYQKDLGSGSKELAVQMQQFNPDFSWIPVAL